MAAETSDRSTEVSQALLMILLRQFNITRISAICQFLFSPCVENEKEAQFQCRRGFFILMRMASIDDFVDFFFDFFFFFARKMGGFIFVFVCIIVWCALSPSVGEFTLVQLSRRYSDR